MAKKKLTVPEVLRKYQKEQKFDTDIAFAEAIFVSRQRLNNWLAETNKPMVPYLKLMALSLMPVEDERWKAHMAVDLLKAMDAEGEIPCSCRTLEGDNEFCPRHFGSPSTAAQDGQKAELKKAEVMA